MKKLFLALTMVCMFAGCAASSIAVKPNDTDKVKIEKLQKQIVVADTQIAIDKKEIKNLVMERNGLLLLVLIVGIVFYNERDNVKKLIAKIKPLVAKEEAQVKPLVQHN